MLRPVCDLCRKDIDQMPAPGQIVQFCETCLPHSEEYIAGVMRIVQDEASVQARRLENFRKEYLQRIKQSPVPRPRTLEVVRNEGA